VCVAAEADRRAADCVRSLLDQGLGERLEVLLVDVASPGAPPVPGSDGPQVRVLELSPATTFASARAAGLRTVAVTSSYGAEELSEAEVVIGSLADLDLANLQRLLF